MANKLSKRELVIIASCEFVPRYSGDESVTFWHEVNRATNDRTLYDFACALQDLEQRVLGVLNASVRRSAKQTILQQKAKRR